MNGDVEMNTSSSPIHDLEKDQNAAKTDDENRKKVRLENSTFLIDALHATPRVQGVVFGIYAIQITVLIASMVASAQSAVQPYNMQVVAIGGIYATLAIIAEGYRDAERMLFYFIRFIDPNKTKNVSQMNCFTLGLEMCVISLSVLTLLLSVPQQEDIPSIVLNCTAIICVSKLDDAVFEKFVYHVYVDKSFDPEREVLDFAAEEEKVLFKRFLPIVAGLLFYVSLLVWAYQFNSECNGQASCN